MARQKKQIEQDIKTSIHQLMSLLKEYLNCNTNKNQWAKSTLTFSIDALEALKAFLERQMSKVDQAEQDPSPQNHTRNEKINIAEE